MKYKFTFLKLLDLIIYIRCGHVVRNFKSEAKTRCNFQLDVIDLTKLTQEQIFLRLELIIFGICFYQACKITHQNQHKFA